MSKEPTGYFNGFNGFTLLRNLHVYTNFGVKTISLVYKTNDKLQKRLLVTVSKPVGLWEKMCSGDVSVLLQLKMHFFRT